MGIMNVNGQRKQRQLQLLLTASISPQQLFQSLAKFHTLWFLSMYQEFSHDPIRACTSNVHMCNKAMEFQGAVAICIKSIAKIIPVKGIIFKIKHSCIVRLVL